MATHSNEMPEGAALLLMLFKNTDGQLGTMFDLRNVPVKGLEIEQKYEIPGKDAVTKRYAFLIEKIGPAVRRLGYEIADVRGFVPYYGIDQYYIARKKHDSAIFRHRYSANVPAELGVKIQTTQGGNLIRGEFNIPIPDSDVQSVRAFMAIVCKLVGMTATKHFCIQQTGIFWTFVKPSGEKCEVVAYKVSYLDNAAPRLFVVIEPKKFDSPEEALRTIKKIEKSLKLTRMQCNKSIAELYEPK